MKNLLLIVIAIYMTLQLPAQSNKQAIQHNSMNVIGIQINPFLNQAFFDGSTTMFVYSMRYLRSCNPYFSIGSEYSGFYYFQGKQVVNSTTGTKSCLGFVARGTINWKDRMSPFLDINASGYWGKTNSTSSNTQTEKYDGFNYYVAPGIKFFPKNKFSLDLMYKFSTKYIIYGKYTVISWKLCYSF